MKYAMLPSEWEETTAVLDVAGHERVALADAEFLVFTGGPEDFPAKLPGGLKFVQVPFAGVDEMLDVMRNSGVRWSNAAGVYDQTVAESAIGLLLAQLHSHKRVTQAASWSVRDEAEAHTSFLFEDSTVAIIGAGGIGARLIEMLSGFGPRIIAVNRSGNAVDGAGETVAAADIAEVWPRADYFFLLAPLTEETRGMVNADVLSAMPDHAVVINVGRGPLVDTDALVAALDAGEIAGAGLDVTDPEPLPDGHPLWDNPDCIITPHLANPPYSVRKRIGAHTVQVAAAVAAGKDIPTEVDPEKGY